MLIKKIFCFFLLISITSVLFINQLSAESKIRISDAFWEFGEVTSGELLKKDLIILNTGDTPLLITLRVSCECIKLSSEKIELMKDEFGNKTEYIYIESNDKGTPLITWMVEGNHIRNWQ